MFFLIPPTIFVFLALIWYIRHVERGLQAWPPEAQKIAPKRWSEFEIKETYKQVEKEPIDFTPHLPKKLDRRYIVVGGSGLVGGFIILHLLARGQDPRTIRNVDFRRPVRSDMQSGKVRDVEFLQADITDEESIKTAFNRPWASRQVERLPLTVFHTAAVIKPGDRAKIAYSLVSRVNVVGCANTLAAAKSAGASVFIATSSGSISIRPLKMWIKPWESCPSNMVQIYPDADKDRNIRDFSDYFGNYAVSKARAEEMVLHANSEKIKTGCIRPACGVYGLAEKDAVDLTLGTYLRAGRVPSWIPNIAQSFVSAQHVSIAHLHYESAIISSPYTTSGRSFTVTDGGTAPQFRDIYTLASLLCGFRWMAIPSLAMLPVAYIVEAYTLSRLWLPALQLILPELKGNIAQVQPALWNITCSHQFASNEQAERSPERGGIGFRAVHNTLQGMCAEAKMWNDQASEKEKMRRWEQSKLGEVLTEMKNIATPAISGV